MVHGGERVGGVVTAPHVEVSSPEDLAGVARDIAERAAARRAALDEQARDSLRRLAEVAAEANAVDPDPLAMARQLGRLQAASRNALADFGL